MQKLLISAALAAAVLVGCTGDTSEPDPTDQTQQGYTGSPRSTGNQNSNTTQGVNGPYGNPAAHPPPIDQAQIDDPSQNIEATNSRP